MRTVFLGTSDFAAALLGDLAGGAHRPALVLTRPDRPAGRGRKLSSPPVAETARELGLELAQPENVNERGARELIAAVQPQAVIVCAFGALIKEPLLSEYELLNVHPSLLPRWRGAAPVERAILAGDAETGVAVMRMEAGLDTGPVYRSERVAIGADETAGELLARLAALGAELLLEVLAALAEGRARATAQQGEATYAERLSV
ncbi:MAG: methionyl-tRNA formyltransferase, partial [Solirubrobacteraceae bacterium]